MKKIIFLVRSLFTTVIASLLAGFRILGIWFDKLCSVTEQTTDGSQKISVITIVFSVITTSIHSFCKTCLAAYDKIHFLGIRKIFMQLIVITVFLFVCKAYAIVCYVIDTVPCYVIDEENTGKCTTKVPGCGDRDYHGVVNDVGKKTVFKNAEVNEDGRDDYEIKTDKYGRSIHCVYSCRIMKDCNGNTTDIKLVGGANYIVTGNRCTGVANPY